jgi:hypothetical protein
MIFDYERMRSKNYNVYLHKKYATLSDFENEKKG